jgi:SWI/SNF-related matrix-associated actin-dependent regulator of chromatin subfamily A member 5
MVILDKLLKSMKEKGSRVLIFSQMSRMLDIMEDYCLFRGYSAPFSTPSSSEALTLIQSTAGLMVARHTKTVLRRLTSTTRKEATSSSSCSRLVPVVLVSTSQPQMLSSFMTPIGTDVSLCFRAHVNARIRNPQADLQAMDRAHRIGQTKQVYVFRFITEESVEERMLERAAQKLRLDQLVIQQGRTQQQKGT